MAQVTLRKVVKIVRRGRGGQRDRSRYRRQGIRRAGRPVGLRQVDDLAHDRRAGRDHRRRDRGRRRRRQRRAAERPRHGDGVPELRALSAHDGLPEHVVRAAAEEVSEGRDRQARAGGRPHPRHQGTARAQAAPALRRAAPARRDGPRDRAQSESVPVRRAALEPRRQAARADAHRDQARAPEGAHHHGLRHARPGRGDDARRSRGGDEQGQDRADRRAEPSLPFAGDALRRGLHRLAGDELHSLQAGAGGRWPERAAVRHDRLRGAGRSRAALSPACRQGADLRHPAGAPDRGQDQRLEEPRDVRRRHRGGRADGQRDDGVLLDRRHRGVRRASIRTPARRSAPA